MNKTRATKFYEEICRINNAYVIEFDFFVPSTPFVNCTHRYVVNDFGPINATMTARRRLQAKYENAVITDTRWCDTIGIAECRLVSTLYKMGEDK